MTIKKVRPSPKKDAPSEQLATPITPAAKEALEAAGLPLEAEEQDKEPIDYGEINNILGGVSFEQRRIGG